MHDHGGLTPEAVWEYIRDTTKDNVDYRNRIAVEFLQGYVAFCKIDHPDIIIPLTGNSHKLGGKYSKPAGTYQLPPEKRKRKTYLCKVHDGILGGTVGGCLTLMGRVGGIYIPTGLADRRLLGIPKIVKKGTYDVEEDEGQPLTASQARWVIEKLSNAKIIAICYFMNGKEIEDAFFDKIPIDDTSYKWSKEKQLTENLKIISNGFSIKEGRFAVQDRYIKFSMKEVNSENIDELAHILFEKLSKIEDADSLRINKKKVSINEKDIQKSLKEWLEN